MKQFVAFGWVMISRAVRGIKIWLTVGWVTIWLAVGLIAILLSGCGFGLMYGGSHYMDLTSAGKVDPGGGFPNLPADSFALHDIAFLTPSSWVGKTRGQQEGDALKYYKEGVTMGGDCGFCVGVTPDGHLSDDSLISHRVLLPLFPFDRIPFLIQDPDGTRGLDYILLHAVDEYGKSHDPGWMGIAGKDGVIRGGVPDGGVERFTARAIPYLQQLEAEGFSHSLYDDPVFGRMSAMIPGSKKYIGILTVYQVRREFPGGGKNTMRIRLQCYIFDRVSGRLKRIQISELSSLYAIESLAPYYRQEQLQKAKAFRYYQKALDRFFQDCFR